MEDRLTSFTLLDDFILRRNFARSYGPDEAKLIYAAIKQIEKEAMQKPIRYGLRQPLPGEGFE
jgi:hypothetical protein